MTIFGTIGNVSFGPRPGYGQEDSKIRKELEKIQERLDVQGILSLSSFFYVQKKDPLIREWCDAQDIAFDHIETTDHLAPPREGRPEHCVTVGKIQEVVAFLCAHREKRIFVYCGSGRGRSHLMILCNLMKERNVSARQAAWQLWGDLGAAELTEIRNPRHGLCFLMDQYAEAEGLPLESLAPIGALSLADCVVVAPKKPKVQSKKPPKAPKAPDSDPLSYEDKPPLRRWSEVARASHK